MATFTDRQIFYINSSNRLSGTDSNFMYQLEINPDADYDRATVLQCSIPKSYYLIENGFNTFTLQEGISSVTVTIPIGNYNRRSIQTVLQSMLNTSSPNNWTYTVNYPNTQSQSDTGKFTFTVSGNGPTQPAFIFTDKVYEPLGFNANSTNQFVGNSLTSTNVIKLQAEDTIYIRSDLVTNGFDNTLQEVFSTSDPSYASINFISPSPEGYAKRITSNRSTVFNFYITDENKRPIDLNGQNLQIVLMMYKEQDIYRMIKGFIKYFLSMDGNKNVE